MGGYSSHRPKTKIELVYNIKRNGGMIMKLKIVEEKEVALNFN